MKSIIVIAVLLLFLKAAVSCVDNNDYCLPEVSVEEPSIIVNSSISTLIATFNDLGSDVLNFSSIGEGLVIEGYVVSSDEAGNMYKVLAIQNKPESPTAAIQLAVDAVDMYAFYNIGRKVYVKLDGLGMHDNNGVLEIGKVNGASVGRIPFFNDIEKDHILRSSIVTEIVPREISSIADLNISHNSMLVSLNNMQAESKGQTYGNLDNTFNANRVFNSCIDGEKIIMRNSGFADFKAQSIPDMSGNIIAVIGNYRGDFQLFIRDTYDLDFTEARCDPIFGEDFQTATDDTNLDIDGWINYAEAGSKVWMESVYQRNGYAEFNPFGSGDSSNIVWLITPEINLEAQDNEMLTFQTQHAYPDEGHDPLEVLISTDFNGEEGGVENATWAPLPFKVSYLENFSSWFTFTDSGEIDLSAYSGTAYIAFKYTGSDINNENMTLNIENVKVSAN
ncbi:protein of unknown function [Tenacibaculum sp. MAR_2009_124]|uniref:DUF5689 domain-containing protein n=1 Tax=Tenacibaculum sp. MAR_2009_124 TaxID=1250059 RepID=UPI00089BCCBF|nr:DUF5689 domain-containing protein [Tenacibaculum sp. MAR_2009_124]SEC29579.1 protein of unknown function [Tenacibaculum sp. MAR_2009_124]